MMFLQCIQQGGCKSEVTLHELVIILRTIHACKIKDEITLLTPRVELLWSRIDVVLKYFIDLEISIAAGLAFFYVVQLAAKVLAHESFGAGNQNLHYFARFSTPFNSFWIYSRAPILAIVSSKFRRYVLSELNSSMVARFTSPFVKYWS